MYVYIYIYNRGHEGAAGQHGADLPADAAEGQRAEGGRADKPPLFISLFCVLNLIRQNFNFQKNVETSKISNRIHL